MPLFTLRSAPRGTAAQTRGRADRYSFHVRLLHSLLHAGLSRRTRIALLLQHCGSTAVHHTHRSLPLKMQSSESSGGNLRLSTSCSAPFSEPMVVTQPQSTRVEEPTLLCNQVEIGRISPCSTRPVCAFVGS